MTLDTTSRTKLAALLSEIKSRNLTIPEEVKHKTSVNWPIPVTGYFSKKDGKLYNPTIEQKSFIESLARYALFIGSRGSGKSAAGSQKALHKIREGQDGAILNPDFENFKISTWPEFREWIPWDMVVPKHRYRSRSDWQPLQPFVLAFLNGARVICKGLKDPDSARGPNINWLWYDEAGKDKTGESWKIAVASVRVGKNPQAWATGTPSGKLHWLYKFFIQQDIPDDAKKAFESEGLDRNLIEHYFGSMVDNKDNLDPGFYASMLAAYPGGWLRQQEVMGQFVDASGALGDRSWFQGKILTQRPDPINMKMRIRYWDMAATEKKMQANKATNDPDEAVGTLMSFDGVYKYIEDQQCGHWTWAQLKEAIKQTAIMDGPAVKIIIEEEPGSGGKNQVAAVDEFIRAELPGHPGVEGYRPEGDRVMLANYWFAEAKQGFIFVVVGPWLSDFFDQLDSFPEYPHDDKITSVNGARMNIAPIRKWKDIQFMNL